MINLSEALARLGDDRQLLSEIAALFLDDCPRRLLELHSAVKKPDAQRVSQVAHSLRGSLSTFGADSAVAAAAHVEELARAGDLTNIAAASAALEAEVASVIRELELLRT